MTQLPPEFVQEMLASDLVSIKNSKNYPRLGIVKYKRKVFFRNLWDELLENCRGLVFDENYEIVSLPFKKIYNFGIEKNSPQLDDNEQVVAYKKFNGFMVAITNHGGEVVVSTTGSLDSAYVDLARSLITEEIFLEVLNNPSHTYLFECVDDSDLHIIKEKTKGLLCLARRKKELDSELEFDEKYLHPAVYSSKLKITVGDLKHLAKIVKHEGFVFYATHNRKQISSKLKSTYYLVTKFLARTQNLSKKLHSKYEVDEEYYGLVESIRENIETFEKMSEQERISFVERYFS